MELGRFGLGICKLLLQLIDSIRTNIAEGYVRDSAKFYYNARRTLLESKNWTYLLHQRELIDYNIYDSVAKVLEVLGKRLTGFIKSINTQYTDNQYTNIPTTNNEGSK